jgi:hypothetical protein
VTSLSELDAVAPDIPAALEGWRAWRVVEIEDRYLLGSIVKAAYWQPLEALEAECLHRRSPIEWMRGGGRHDAPGSSCQCGIYAGGLRQAGEYLRDLWSCGSRRPTVARVLGRVSLWGTVVECERGFRASRAYPSRIYVPRDDQRRAEQLGSEELALHLGVYGVPVEPLDAGCAEAPEALAALLPSVD